MPACCNLKILAWESKAYSFCDHMKVSDVPYPRHIICFLQGSAQLQGLDEERLAKMAEHLNQYNCQLSSMGPGFQTVSGQWPVSSILLCARYQRKMNQYYCQLSSMGHTFWTVSGWWLVRFFYHIDKTNTVYWEKVDFHTFVLSMILQYICRCILKSAFILYYWNHTEFSELESVISADVYVLYWWYQ